MLSYAPDGPGGPLDRRALSPWHPEPQLISVPSLAWPIGIESPASVIGTGGFFPP